MLVYKHPDTGDTKIVKFPWVWLITPICCIDLILKGKIMHGLVGWMPIFTLIWLIKYESILSDVWEKKGYVKS